MRTLLSTTVLAIAMMSGCCDVQAQDAHRAPSVMDDLCACMSTIDLGASDGAVNGEVRNCLEDAVIDHPTEVRAILTRSHGQGSKAFQLGAMLGGGLERSCEHFRAVRARLQQMPPGKQGT